jgi:hypothetical protein
MRRSYLETTATENPSYDLAAEWVVGRIAAEMDRGEVADDGECVTVPAHVKADEQGLDSDETSHGRRYLRYRLWWD